MVKHVSIAPKDFPYESIFRDVDDLACEWRNLVWDYNFTIQTGEFDEEDDEGYMVDHSEEEILEHLDYLLENITLIESQIDTVIEEIESSTDKRLKEVS